MNFQKLGASLAGFGRRSFTTAAKNAATKPWRWSTRIVAVAGGSSMAWYVLDSQLHPRPNTEILDDLMLQKPLNNRKERVVVLGSGWGAVSLLAKLDPFKYDIVCISPRNHFVMTPLLPSVTVGTIESRTIVESIRAICPHVTFVEAECTSFDKDKKVLSFINGASDVNSLTPGVKLTRSVSHNLRARTRPEFQMAYDKLVVAVGADNNTFNTPGVEQNAHFLKEMKDARAIRGAIIDSFESACNPGQTEADRKKLLSFVVVGGGPTGVEYAAELADLLHEDLKAQFPKLKSDVQIKLVEATDKMLGMFSKEVSEATASSFEKEGIEFLANTFVKEVKPNEVVIQRKGATEKESLAASVIVWATGIKCRPITNKLRECIGLDVQTNFRALVTDSKLKVKGANHVYALGDCATIEGAPLPATAQVAAQEGKYLAAQLNGLKTMHSDASLLNSIRRQFWAMTGATSSRDFEYAHKGSLAYIGGDRAAADFNKAFAGALESMGLPVMTGTMTNYLWKAFYFSEQLSVRTKALLAVDWIKAKAFGRDFSRY